MGAMTYNFLTVEPLTSGAVATALARWLGLSVEDVDVADEDTDQDLRNWDALVLCEKATVLGDMNTSLDIYVQEAVQPHAGERDLGVAFARAADVVVLFPAEEMPPSAYWLATEDGLVTRARLYESDEEEPRFTIDRVEAPVARLPQVTVARIPEVVREAKTATPLGDAFVARVRSSHSEEAGSPGTPLWQAGNRLCAREKLVRQMGADWAPSGWYPLDLCRERLEARDKLEGMSAQLPLEAAALLHASLEPLDALFAEATVAGPVGLLRGEPAGAESAAPAHGWWWDRRPEPLPW
ncbi:hypothetical protein [Streptomyces sp. NPDC005435]|uniref:hypothetical protein n=1 Tax=Streptomyces sp. NPDC005435 TaxID=3154464 RepID=UPI003451555B